MERRQIIVVIAVLLAFVIAVVWAARASKGQGARSAPTFFARSGKMRDKAQMLVTKKKPVPTTLGKSADTDTSDDTISSIKSLSAQTDDAPPSEEEQIAQEALNALTPEDGIEKIQAALATLEATEQAAALYAALGRLYAQTDPPDIAQAQTAFSAALELAQSVEARQQIAQVEATMLLSQKLPDLALKRVSGVLGADPTVSPARFQLLIMLGKLKDDAGDLDAAEAAYREVFDQPVETLERLGPEGSDVYRQACLHLARLYRKTGREAEAAKLTKTMKQRLSVLDRP